nr:MAG TPA: major capsid protein [Caudoviricetes sp.]
MAIVLDRQNSGKVVDRTDSLIVIPNTVGITNALGLFEDTYSTQKTIEITRTTRKSHLLEDRNWDERNQTIAGREQDSLLLKIPHVPLDDAITPNDIDGIVQAGSLAEFAELETVASVRADKMIAIREAHGLTLEAARMQLITTGTAYAPRGTIVTNYYTEFGVTRTEIVTDLSAAADPRAVYNEAKKAARNSLRDGQAGTVRSWVVLCSDSYYNALQQNAYVTDAFKYVDQGQATRILLGAGGADVPGLDARFEMMSVFGITFINAGAAGYDDPVTGAFVPFIPEGDAYMMPVGIRNFLKTYYAPANRMNTVNRRAQGSYFFEYLNEKDDIIEIMTEQNFLNAVLNPGAILRLSLT